MERVSTAMTNNDLQYRLRSQENALYRMRSQITSRQQLSRLRDDPIAAGHLVRYDSYLTRINGFEENAKKLTDKFSVAEGYLTESVNVMHRIRELAVTGANGTFTPDDLKTMAVEVNELLKELVQNANAVGPDGSLLFAGTRAKGAAFEAEMGDVPHAAEPMITAVRYQGNIEGNKIEIDETHFMDVNSAGNRIFWAEPQRLYSERDGRAYQAPADGSIAVDGVEIPIKTGDNIYAVAAKINDSGAAVRASIDPVIQGLNLETTDSRQLWLEDNQGSTLFDLGVIKDSAQRPPYNIGDGARTAGASLFDSVISLRDALLSGDQEAIGGKVLGVLDQGFENLTRRMAETGSAYERAALNAERNSVTAYNTTAMITREGVLDDAGFAKAYTDMKMMEYAREATMSVAAKLYSSTLLNYIR
ncbi:MAG: flagellar hook-associated protein 3 [Treponema sp.]|jgi:flagellar hook-associated protein 3 FlgL|nr:flagellar hook-associated protein 3 [Treponema sp.]